MNIEDRLIDFMFEMGRLIRRQMHEWQLGLSPVQFGTLAFIAERNVTMKDVATYLNVAAPSATIIVEELVKRKMVARTQDRRDRRIVRLTMTARGKALLRKSAELKARILHGSLHKLTPAQREQLITILSKLTSHEK